MTTKLISFCRTIFMVDNPTKGVMFGVSLLLLHAWLTPIYGFYCLSLWVAKDKGSLAVLAPIWVIIALYCLIITLSNTIRLVIRYSTNRFFCVIWAIISCISAPLFTLLLLIQYIKERRVYWAVLAGITTLSLVVLLLDSTLIQYAMIFTLLQIATIAGTNKDAKFSWLFVYPLVAIGLSWGSLYLYQGELQDRVAEQRAEISRYLDYSIELEEFYKRSAEGISLESEPLKSLIDNFNELEGQPSEKAIKALDEFLQLPVEKIAHDTANLDNLAEMEFPELRTFRNATRYIADNIIATPQDKAKVKQYNSDLIKLRDWTINSADTLIGNLVSMAIENVRIDTLSHVLATGAYTTEEFSQLLGPPIEWRKLLMLSIADDAVMFESIFNQFYSGNISEVSEDIAKVTKVYMPVYLEIYFLKDYSFALSNYLKIIQNIESNTSTVDEFEEKFILSTMLLPALDRINSMVSRAENRYFIATLASDIMEQYKLTGELPTTVELPLAPNGKEILYKSGDIVDDEGEEFYGFRLYTTEENSYSVHLTKE